MHNFFNNDGLPINDIDFSKTTEAPLIITIGRQLASGGREIGKIIAKALNMPYYDKEILDCAARDSGFAPEFFERTDERKGFFQTLFSNNEPLLGHATAFYQNQMSDDHLFRLQADAIRRIAAKHVGGVFIGRCADYVLRDYPNCLNIFISAELGARVETLMKREHIEREAAQKLLSKGDSRRADYYNYYASGKWGVAHNYDLCINASYLGIEGTVQFILDFIEKNKRL